MALYDLEVFYEGPGGTPTPGIVKGRIDITGQLANFVAQLHTTGVWFPEGTGGQYISPTVLRRVIFKKV